MTLRLQVKLDKEAKDKLNVPSLCFHLDSHEKPQHEDSLRKCCSQHFHNSNHNSLRKGDKVVQQCT
jgi:hypothetical protein